MKKAFTLAEVLITLAIVGVIATMTVPSMMNSYQKKVLVTQLQKAYAEVSQGVARALLEENTAYIGKVSNNSIMKQLPGVSCTFDNCMSYLKDNYSEYIPNGADISCRKGESGWTVCLWDTHSLNNINGVNVYIKNGLLDANGPKPPNLNGVDIYTIKLNNSNGKLEGYDMALSNVIANDWDINY